uniref:glutathione-specific gamma-glutamylcyclotransferase n=1 Tax=Chromera velia CCMP2878 TaxID=1169474 RepID=A0A0G4HY76_9ALVE|eukprot:Cvel_9423.t1-p1 / transcript=Cvel_9423.t1 / gene=Cvel_9423 / organism=Chromera_velia_CCMP2878 / gene_product=Cation transport regulator-like protein 2, putative / transcript_product=Cation transport regulator-like protein 2, putative / location=Cvel_scaffold543:16715-17491(-) / protein_length=259 / sequence_SO=supercontig / SO=protein_coding / is_pseudo=false
MSSTPAAQGEVPAGSSPSPQQPHWNSELGIWEGGAPPHDEGFEVPKPLWIFGYGSLCWRNDDFSFVEKKTGKIQGFCRRFFQLSTDHRGTPTFPGRVATVIPVRGDQADSSWVVGVAYRIADEEADKVLAYLDFREKGGYTRHLVDVSPLGGQESGSTEGPIRAVMYAGTEDNPAYSSFPDEGEELEKAVRQIHKAVGPSGPNVDYLRNVATFLHSCGAEAEQLDHHTIGLADAVERLGGREGKAEGEEGIVSEDKKGG